MQPTANVEAGIFSATYSQQLPKYLPETVNG